MREERILLFSGTTEGRRLAAILSRYPARVFVSVATEYGKESTGLYKNVEILCGRKNRKEIADLIWEKQITRVIDATHPFARQATENIRLACADTDREYIRCVREAAEEGKHGSFLYRHAKIQGQDEECILVDSIEQAVDYLQDTEGNILITTGSKELQIYQALPHFHERCYVRVLPVKESLEKCLSLGIEGRHLLAMQGPFSEEMNLALLRHVNAAFLVTKESGSAGGYVEKLSAARAASVKAIVIRRPCEEGKTVEEIAKMLEEIRIVPCNKIEYNEAD